MTATADVAIIGLGPTGATLANLLGEQGVSTLVLERETHIYPLPRAVHFDGETMRILQSIGLQDAVKAIARPGTQGMHFVSGTGQTLLIRQGSDQPGPQGHHNSWYFHQPELEALLRQRMAQHPSVRLCLGHHTESIAADADGVTLHSVDSHSGKTQRHRVRYVVGCDGARSAVRASINSHLQDRGLKQAWLCLDVLTHRDMPLPPYTVQWCDPQRPMTMVNKTGRRRRWEIMVLPSDDSSRLTQPDFYWPLIQRWVTPNDAVIERAAAYTFHSVVAQSWHQGRVFIAGDAAHQTPPFLGQGMCAGLRDASNIAWKLKAVLSGAVHPDVLTTYGSERLNHVREFIDLAVRLGAIIQETDPERARQRDAEFAQQGATLFAFPQPRLGPGAYMAHQPSAGFVAPQFTLPNGRLMDDAMGHRFALLLNAAPHPQLTPAAQPRLHQADVSHVVAEPHSPMQQWLTQHHASAVLLRPDRYVAGWVDQATSWSALDAWLTRLAEPQ